MPQLEDDTILDSEFYIDGVLSCIICLYEDDEEDLNDMAFFKPYFYSNFNFFEI